jgi:hypothetical protein
VLAPRVILGPTHFARTSGGWFAGGVVPADDHADVASREKVTAADLPCSLDNWDGFPAT